MLILGIDPGYATVGYGLVQHERGKFTHIRHGAITTQPHVPMHLRLKEIHEDMLTLLDTFHPDAVSVEELFFNTNITTGIQVAHARGMKPVEKTDCYKQRGTGKNARIVQVKDGSLDSKLF